VKTTDKIINQLAKVREDGRANMMDRRAVQAVANDLELYDLVVWCEDVRKKPEQYMAALQAMGERREVEA